MTKGRFYMANITENPIWNRVFNEMARDGVSELTSNGPNQFFINVHGVRKEIIFPKMSDRAYDESIEQGLVPFVTTQRAYKDSKYLFEGRLLVKSAEVEFEGRCHIEMPPSCYSPQVTITKKAKSLLTIDQIAASGAMSTEMLAFLKEAVRANLTIAISGKTGAGKTTMLESLTRLWSDNDRIGVAEDTPELILSQPNVTYSHSEPFTPDQKKEELADLTYLIRQWQRKRLSKGVIGETRGPEFSEFLVAANSGLEGSMTTLHANDPVACLDKMTRFALKGSTNQPIRSINMEIGSTIDLIIQLKNIDGKHRISHIAEVTSVISDSENARLSSQSLYEFDKNSNEFVKENSITDELRSKFTEAKVDLRTFLSTEVGTRSQPHSSSGRSNIEIPRAAPDSRQRAPQGRPTRGLPDFGREI